MNTRRIVLMSIEGFQIVGMLNVDMSDMDMAVRSRGQDVNMPPRSIGDAEAPNAHHQGGEVSPHRSPYSPGRGVDANRGDLIPHNQCMC